MRTFLKFYHMLTHAYSPNGYDGQEEDSAMDEEHDHVGVAVGIIADELGAGPVGSAGPGGSISGKRKQ